jgi:C-terminal peptidase prc
MYIPADCAGTPIATVPAATEQALPTPSVQANRPIDQKTQLHIFDEVTKVISDVYVYPNFNANDWQEIAAAHRAKVAEGLSTEAFYNDLQGLVNELGDNHSRFDSPVDVAESQAELAGTSQFVGIGILAVPDQLKNRIDIGGLFPGSPAEHSGLKIHDSILSVDGLPLVQDGAVYTYRVRGPECSAERLTVQSPGQSPRDVWVMRHSIQGDLPVDARLVNTTDGSRIGYIMLPSFFDEKIPGEVADALKKFGTLDGLIIDNRLNGGGSSDVVEPVLSYFASGGMGSFRSRVSSRPFTIQANPIANSQTVPLVVLVGMDTASFGEIFSGILQDQGRAKLVGQHSAGNVEILHGYNFEDGSTLWIAEETFDPSNRHTNWEHTGVIPDVQAYAPWDSFTFDNDPAVLAAVHLLGHK